MQSSQVHEPFCRAGGYFIFILGLSDQCPWASIRKIEFSEEQCWPQKEALGHYLASWATMWQYGPLFGSDIVKTA